MSVSHWTCRECGALNDLGIADCSCGWPGQAGAAPADVVQSLDEIEAEKRTTYHHLNHAESVLLTAETFHWLCDSLRAALAVAAPAAPAPECPRSLTGKHDNAKDHGAAKGGWCIWCSQPIEAPTAKRIPYHGEADDYLLALARKHLYLTGPHLQGYQVEGWDAFKAALAAGAAPGRAKPEPDDLAAYWYEQGYKAASSGGAPTVASGSWTSYLTEVGRKEMDEGLVMRAEWFSGSPGTGPETAAILSGAARPAEPPPDVLKALREIEREAVRPGLTDAERGRRIYNYVAVVEDRLRAAPPPGEAPRG